MKKGKGIPAKALCFWTLWFILFYCLQKSKEWGAVRSRRCERRRGRVILLMAHQAWVRSSPAPGTITPPRNRPAHEEHTPAWWRLVAGDTSLLVGPSCALGGCNCGWERPFRPLLGPQGSVSRGGNAHLHPHRFWNAEANGPTLSLKGYLVHLTLKVKLKIWILTLFCLITGFILVFKQ